MSRSLNYNKAINPVLISSFYVEDGMLFRMMVNVDGGSLVEKEFYAPIQNDVVKVSMIVDYDDNLFLSYEDMLEIKSYLKSISRQTIWNICN